MSYEYMIGQLFEASLYTILFLLAGVFLTTIYLRTHNKQINWLYLAGKYRYVLFTVFYYLLVLRITCFSRIHFQGINLRLFASYEDAWFGGSSHAWQQLLLNIIMFIPLGMTLPFVHRFFRRWYGSLLTLFGGSLLIETIQFVFELGVFEADDLLNNTLGGMLGFCIVMMVLSARTKRWKPLAGYTALPVMILLISLSAFILYWSKPYGNLTYSVFRPYALSQTNVSYRHKLSKKQPMIGMYRLRTPNQKQIRMLIRTLEIKLKLQDQPLINENSIQQVRSYANGQLIINKENGSWSYARIAGDGTNQDNNWLMAKHTGEKLGLVDSAAKLQKPEDSSYAVWVWKLDGTHNGKKGTLMLSCGENGIVNFIDYDVSQYTYVRKEKAISQNRAFSKLKHGEFRASSAITAKRIVFDRAALEYQLDSKNYLQPVYIFWGKSERNEWEIVIPALP